MNFCGLYSEKWCFPTDVSLNIPFQWLLTLNFMSKLLILANFLKILLARFGSSWYFCSSAWLEPKPFNMLFGSARLEPEFFTEHSGSARLELRYFRLGPPLCYILSPPFSAHLTPSYRWSLGNNDFQPSATHVSNYHTFVYPIFICTMPPF